MHRPKGCRQSAQRLKSHRQGEPRPGAPRRGALRRVDGRADDGGTADVAAFTLHRASGSDAGQRALGGGVRTSDTVTQIVDDSYPRGTDGWEAHVSNFGQGQQSFTVFVICTSADATS